MDALRLVHTLTFDLFGTILDLGGCHAPRLRAFLTSHGSNLAAEELWARWRNRQRIEQYQDNLSKNGVWINGIEYARVYRGPHQSGGGPASEGLAPPLPTDDPT